MLLHEELEGGGYRVFLASQSPRRQQLMADAGLQFETIKYDVDELYSKDIPCDEVPLFLAKLKSDNFPRELTPRDIVITADTVVISRGEILGKPNSLEGARQMLRQLSGEHHQVTTGVYIKMGGHKRGFSTHTKVWFKELSEDEIDHYVRRYSPLDKAGSYGIQEWIGYVGVERIEGSFYNVMGLPIQKLYCELLDMVTSKRK